MQLAAIEQHLINLGYLGGIGEQAGIAGDTALEGGSLIVDMALQQLLAQELVV